MTLILEFIAAVFATGAFSVLYHVPKEHWLYAGLTGGIGWIVYRLFLDDLDTALAIFVAVLAVTFLARIFAVMRKAPVTIFLVSGILPLVPGVGIYYTSYYFIMEDALLAGRYGVETVKIAIAIALGIIFILSIPQKCFSIFRTRKKDRKR